jgi:iron complex transport system substrate-binding protein
LAQIALYTLAPSKLVGLSSEMSESEKEYLPESFTELPVFGGFTQGTLNLEALMTADPQIIIDVGELKENHAQDLEEITEKTGIPAIFIRMELDNLSEAYKTLGELLGETEQSYKITAYLDKTMADMKNFASQITDDKKTSVYYAQDDGLSAVVNNSIHDDVIRFVNGDNVAKIESNAKGGSATISMEQLMNWNPEVILFVPGSIYDDVAGMSEWSALTAISDDKYYEIPATPYNWLGRPPSINRVIGIQWLGNLLYPEVFDYDIKAVAKEFYSLFYHIEITDEQIETMLSKSTLKS